MSGAQIYGLGANAAGTVSDIGYRDAATSYNKLLLQERQQEMERAKQYEEEAKQRVMGLQMPSQVASPLGDAPASMAATNQNMPAGGAWGGEARTTQRPQAAGLPVQQDAFDASGLGTLKQAYVDAARKGNFAEAAKALDGINAMRNRQITGAVYQRLQQDPEYADTVLGAYANETALKGMPGIGFSRDKNGLTVMHTPSGDVKLNTYQKHQLAAAMHLMKADPAAAMATIGSISDELTKHVKEFNQQSIQAGQVNAAGDGHRLEQQRMTQQAREHADRMREAHLSRITPSYLQVVDSKTGKLTKMPVLTYMDRGADGRPRMVTLDVQGNRLDQSKNPDVIAALNGQQSLPSHMQDAMEAQRLQLMLDEAATKPGADVSGLQAQFGPRIKLLESRAAAAQAPREQQIAAIAAALKSKDDAQITGVRAVYGFDPSLFGEAQQRLAAEAKKRDGERMGGVGGLALPSARGAGDFTPNWAAQRGAGLPASVEELRARRAAAAEQGKEPAYRAKKPDATPARPSAEAIRDAVAPNRTMGASTSQGDQASGRARLDVGAVQQLPPTLLPPTVPPKLLPSQPRSVVQQAQAPAQTAANNTAAADVAKAAAIRAALAPNRTMGATTQLPASAGRVQLDRDSIRNLPPTLLPNVAQAPLSQETPLDQQQYVQITQDLLVARQQLAAAAKSGDPRAIASYAQRVLLLQQALQQR